LQYRIITISAFFIATLIIISLFSFNSVAEATVQDIDGDGLSNELEKEFGVTFLAPSRTADWTADQCLRQYFDEVEQCKRMYDRYKERPGSKEVGSATMMCLNLALDDFNECGPNKSK
jgi:hypothetical protein